MPHLTMEYSANLPPPDLHALFTSLHDALAGLGVALDDCKSRAYQSDTYLVGTGAADRAFVHLTLLLLDRRPPAFRKAAGELVLELVQRAFTTTSHDCDVTVEVRAMPVAEYFKARLTPRS